MNDRGRVVGRILNGCYRITAVVFSPQNRRLSVLSLAAVAVVAVVSAAVVALEVIDNRSGHTPNGCGSVSRLLIFGTNVAGFIGLLLKLEYSERRQRERLEAARWKLEDQAAARTAELRQNVRHDVRGELQPVVSAAEEAARKADEAREHAAKVEHATNGNLAAAVREAAEQARAAEREQLLADPRFWAAMQSMLRKMLAELCAERKEGE